PEGVSLAEPGVVARVEELERLDEELDLADAAAPELDVRALRAASRDRAVDLALHAADLADHRRVHAGPEHERARQLEEPRGDVAVAGAVARLDQGLALPQLG